MNGIQGTKPSGWKCNWPLDSVVKIIKYKKSTIDHAIYWEKSIKGESINGLTMHAERAPYGVCRKKNFISYGHISQVNSLASIDTSVWPGILSLECQDIEGIAVYQIIVTIKYQTHMRTTKSNQDSHKTKQLSNRRTILSAHSIPAREEYQQRSPPSEMKYHLPSELMSM